MRANSTNESHFGIVCATSVGQTGYASTGQNVESVVVGGLTPGSNYCCSVTAISLFGDSRPSDATCDKAPPMPAPTPPPACPGGQTPSTYWFCLTDPDGECWNQFTVEARNQYTYADARAAAQANASNYIVHDGACTPCP